MTLFSSIISFFGWFMPKPQLAPKPPCPRCGKPMVGKVFCSFCYEYFCSNCLRPHIDEVHPLRPNCPKCGSSGHFHPQLAISVQAPGTDVVITGYGSCPKCGAQWSARGEDDDKRKPDASASITGTARRDAICGPEFEVATTTDDKLS